MDNSPHHSSVQDNSPLEIAGQDEIATPDTHRTYESLNGIYRFEIIGEEHWQSKQATGYLYNVTTDRIDLLWQSRLPQEYGPRYVVVGSQGQVLLLDEFINVSSPYAVVLLNLTGDIVAQYSFDDLERVLNVPRAEIVAQAQQGWWISADPEHNVNRGRVMIETAGKTLSIDLTTGQLTVSEG